MEYCNFEEVIIENKDDFTLKYVEKFLNEYEGDKNGKNCNYNRLM